MEGPRKTSDRATRTASTRSHWARACRSSTTRAGRRPALGRHGRPGWRSGVDHDRDDARDDERATAATVSPNDDRPFWIPIATPLRCETRCSLAASGEPCDRPGQRAGPNGPARRDPMALPPRPDGTPAATRWHCPRPSPCGHPPVMEGHASVIAGLHNTWFGLRARAPRHRERLAKLRTIQELEAEEVTLHEDDEAIEGTGIDGARLPAARI